MIKTAISKKIFCNFILKLVYDYAVDRRELSTLRHVLFIEESQNILPPRKPEMPRPIGERILGELRKFGEGVVVVSQFPSSVSQEVVKNTSVRIIHAIRSGDDLKAIADSTTMNGRQVNSLASLAIGESVVNLPHKSSNIFVRVTPDPLLCLPMPNEAVAEVCLPPQA
ncbi:MAG: hypothetical protein LUP94_00170 [Candidatus Methanomethylicus sp.]|nr:hypothetical protein [Candidatus Methanomethylicus sp.]